MEITIAGYKFKLLEKLDLRLKYDSVASEFSGQLYYDASNPIHRKIFKPLTYHKCVITHGGVTLLTGIVLSHNFNSSGEPPKSSVHISGYSKTGVLQHVVPVVDILERSNVPFIDYVNEFCAHYKNIYGFEVIVDPEVTDLANTILPHVTAEPDDRVAELLNNIASHLGLILSHDRFGNLVITKVKSDKILTTSATYVKPTAITSELEGAPDNIQTQSTAKDRSTLYDFGDTALDMAMSLGVNGQQMYSDIVVTGDYNAKANGSGTETDPLQNPFVQTPDFKTAFDQSSGTTARGSRPYTHVQRNQTVEIDNDAPKTARSILGDCLKNIQLVIDVPTWTLNGHIITPNQMVTVVNKELMLFNRARWFIQEVYLRGDEVNERCTMVCVPPAAFGTDDVINDLF